MNKNEKLTVLLNNVFNLSSTFSSLFLNVYLFVYAKSFTIMCIYTIIRISLFPLFFIIGSKIVKKYSYSLTFSVGLVLIACSSLYALFATSLFEINPNYILIAAVLTGVGEGFYWFSSNSCNQIVSTPESRARFLSISGLFNYVASLSAPLIASFVINHSISDLNAYRTILKIIIALYVIVILISLFINLPHNKDIVPLKESFSLKDKVWKDHSVAVVIYGLRNSLTLALTNLLIYNAVGNGSDYSKLQSLFAFVAVVSFMIMTKALDKKYLKITFIIGVTMAISSTTVLVIFNNIYGAIFFGIANTLSACFYETSYSYISANIIYKYENDTVSRVVARETFLSFGRCLGMGIIILFYYIFPEDIYLKTSVVLLSFSALFVYKIFIKYRKIN